LEKVFGGDLKVGTLVRHVTKGWWGVIVNIIPDPNVKSLWFEIYCSETDSIRGSWDSQVEAI